MQYIIEIENKRSYKIVLKRKPDNRRCDFQAFYSMDMKFRTLKRECFFLVFEFFIKTFTLLG